MGVWRGVVLCLGVLGGGGVAVDDQSKGPKHFPPPYFVGGVFGWFGVAWCGFNVWHGVFLSLGLQRLPSFA